MANTKTAIEWTDATWNVVVGCESVSDGCTHCYARTLHDRRYLAWKRGTFPTAPEQYHQPFKVVQLRPDRLDEPLHWRKPRKVFVNSVSDLFHEDVTVEFIARVWAVMNACPHLTFQILTKRPERMRDLLTSSAFINQIDTQCLDLATANGWTCLVEMDDWPLPNVWLLTSCENQEMADIRIPELIATPAAVHGVSLEPLLESIDLGQCTWVKLAGRVRGDWPIGHNVSATAGIHRARLNPHGAVSVKASDGNLLGIRPAEWEWVRKLDWVIVGGESGPNFRPMEVDWARSIRDQCQAADVPYFFKQLGGHTPKANGRLLDGREWNEFPEVARA